jgi:hypothetical protein
MSPFEALHGIKCHTPVSWDNPVDREFVGSKFLKEMEDQMIKIKRNLKAAQKEPEDVLQVHLVRTLDRKRKQFQNRAIELVKFQWTWYSLEDTTWEHADAMWAEYPHLFENFERLPETV